MDFTNWNSSASKSGTASSNYDLSSLLMPSTHNSSNAMYDYPVLVVLTQSESIRPLFLRLPSPVLLCPPPRYSLAETMTTLWSLTIRCPTTLLPTSISRQARKVSLNAIEYAVILMCSACPDVEHSLATNAPILSVHTLPCQL